MIFDATRWVPCRASTRSVRAKNCYTYYCRSGEAIKRHKLAGKCQLTCSALMASQEIRVRRTLVYARSYVCCCSDTIEGEAFRATYAMAV